MPANSVTNADAASPSVGSDHSGTNPTRRALSSFATADADKNGSVNLAEAQKIWPKLTQDQFNAADTDKNGSLNADEYAALAKTPPAM